MIKSKVKLGYSSSIEVLYKRDLFNKLKFLGKSIRFLHFCKRVILVQLELHLRSKGLKNFYVNTETIVTITWSTVRPDKPIKAKNVAIDNWIDLQDV